MILIGRHVRIRGTLRIVRPAEIAALQRENATLQVELTTVLRENAALRVEVAELRRTLECVRLYVGKESIIIKTTVLAMLDMCSNKARQ